MLINKELFRKAYKKLKSSVYYDKTALILRNKIVEFEYRSNNEDGLEASLDDLYERFLSEDERTFDELCNDILSSIRYHAFPKKIMTDSNNATVSEKENDENDVIFNFSRNTTEIKELQYFIDMDVKGHIIGVVWLMMIGYKIDWNIIYNHSYGNRIRKNLYSEFSDEPTYSPYLFEPYFQQYESWRDYGLDKALEYLNDQRDVVVMTMDFKRFYYSVDMNDTAFERLFEDAGFESENSELKIYKRINDFVCKVVSTYAGLFKENEYDGRCILPIGFLPSNILANWCLRNFDEVIVNGWNPLYYGRYVDDILIVDKVEHNSKLYKRANKQKIKKDELVQFLLQQCTRWNGIHEENNVKDDFNCSKLAPLLKHKNRKEYHVNPLYNPIVNDRSEIMLQNSKLKVFYFKSGETSALITCFKDEISKNKSEFRFMPEDDDVFSDNDYGEIYDLKYEDTINKFRGIEGMSIDPFKLSKFLGKYLRIGSMIDDKVESSFAKDILKIFDHHTIIAHHVQWERILEILLINKHYDAINKFIERIFDAIENIRLKLDTEAQATEEKVRLALYLELHSAIMRVFSLVYTEKTDEIIKHIYQTDKGHQLWKTMGKYSYYEINFIIDENTLRKAYNTTRMSDKSVIPIPIEMLSIDDAEHIDLTSFHDLYSHFDKKIDIFAIKYVYYPYLVNMHDISLMYFFSEINSKAPFNEYEKLHKNQEKLYLKLNYRVLCRSDSPVKVKLFHHLKGKRTANIFHVLVGDRKKNRLKVAIANTRINVNNFTALIKGKPNRSYQRYCDMSNMVNQAMKENADILVMPESYLPFEWLSSLARVCAANQLAIVTGVEYFVDVNNKRIYNFTAIILPYTNNEQKCACISFHLKRHYAPNEIREIQGYGYKKVEGNNYELYKWNDCYFPVYCCFELASITDRSLFQSYADFIIAVEWNSDVNYYSNIMGSLSRDIHCYCIQVNSSDYGDSRITKPSKTEIMDVIRTKGGKNSTILIGDIDIEKLRNFQIKSYELQKDDKDFKPIPPKFDQDIVLNKIRGIDLD